MYFNLIIFVSTALYGFKNIVPVIFFSFYLVQWEGWPAAAYILPRNKIPFEIFKQENAMSRFAF